MNNKFEFKISSRFHYPRDGLIVLQGEWLGGRVARGDCLTLLQGIKKLPCHINAVDIAEGPGKLVLACGHAQDSARLATIGDKLVSSEPGCMKTTAPKVFMTEKDEEAHWVIEEKNHRRAREVLLRCLADMLY